MKIWSSYGSEHSMNLVMIGQFKSAGDAEETKIIIEKLTEKLTKIELSNTRERYGKDTFALLRESNIYTLRPSELEQFSYDTRIRVEKDKLILTTDESEVSAFIKLMIDGGAKIEIFSAHDYPEADYGRSK